jgi:hypothetical protein
VRVSDEVGRPRRWGIVEIVPEPDPTCRAFDAALECEDGDSRWHVTCGQCGRPSIYVKATSKESAWRDLQRVGYALTPDGKAVCRKCATPTVASTPKAKRK